MKKNVFILGFLGFLCSILPAMAQQSTTGGPVLEDIGRAQRHVLYLDDDQIMMSMQKYDMFGKDDLHLITYNKAHRTIKETIVDEDYDCCAAYVKDGKFYALRGVIDKKNKNIRIENILVPDKESVTKRDKLVFSPFLTIPNENNRHPYYNFVFSKDYSKFAIVTQLDDNQRKIGELDIAVFSMDGTLLWQQRNSYDYDPYRLNNFFLSDAGMVTSLSYNISYKNEGTSIVLQSWSENRHDYYKTEMPDKSVYSLDIVQLRNGNVMLAGYYKVNANNNFGLYSLLLDGEDVLSEDFTPVDELISDNFNDYDDPIVRKDNYYLSVAKILELQNGNIVLMSESFHNESNGTDRNGYPLYLQYVKNIYYNLFSSTGDLSEGFVFPHAACFSSGSNSLNFSNDRIAFCVKDDVVYALYGGNAQNYDGRTDSWYLHSQSLTKNEVIVLSSFMENGEFVPTVVLTPEYNTPSAIFARPQYTFVNSIIVNDKDKIYYLLFDKDKLSIEEIDY